MSVRPRNPVEVQGPEVRVGAGAGAAGFSGAVSEVLGGLSQAFAGVLDALPGRVNRAVEVQRLLELDRKLAWQVFKIARAGHPAAEGLNVPTRVAVQKVAQAARRRRVPAEVTDRLIEAFDAFEHFVTEHAGDRESFHSMVGSLVGEVAGTVSDKQRTANYKSNAHLWGVRADATVRCEIYHPKPDDPTKLDMVTVYGCRNLHRLRHDAHVAIQVGAYERGSDERAASELPALLEEFSDPIPGGQWVPDEMGHAHLELGDLGRGSAASFFIMKVNRPSSEAPRLELNNTVAIQMPTALTVVDLMVPVGLSNPSSAKVTVYGSRSKYPFAEFGPADILPQREHATTVRSALAPPELPELALYPQVVRYVLGKMGWETARFDVHRCRVAYPFFHTHIRLEVEETM